MLYKKQPNKSPAKREQLWNELKYQEKVSKAIQSDIDFSHHPLFKVLYGSGVPAAQEFAAKVLDKTAGAAGRYLAKRLRGK